VGLDRLQTAANAVAIGHGQAPVGGCERRRDARRSALGKLLVAGATVAALVVVPAASAATGHVRLGAFSGPGSGDGQLSAPGQAAVRLSDGRLFVADSANNRVEVYTPTATDAAFDQSITDPSISAPKGVTVDQDTGAVYVSDADGITKLNADLTVASAALVSGVTGPLAFNQHNGELYVADTATNVVRTYASDGTPGATFDGTDGSTHFTGLLDIATDSTGDVLVVDATGNRSDLTNGFASSAVLRFGEGGGYETTVGASATPVAVAVKPDTGEVIVGGNIADSYNLNLPLQLSLFASDGTPGETIDLPISDGVVNSQITAVAAPTGPAARLYTVTDVDAASIGYYGTVSIQTYEIPQPAAPGVTTGGTPYVVANSVRFTGTVDPNLLATSYWVEYGVSDQYGSRFPIGHDSAAGDGDDAEAVALQAGDLQPNTTYHYRIVASNALGQRAGADRTVVTDAAAPVPSGEGRSFEMVSPVAKSGTAIGQDNGANSVIGQASADGDRVFYSARGALSSGDPASFLRTVYLADRTATEWMSTSMEAPVLAGPDLRGSSILYISRDASHTLVTSTAVLAPGGVAGVDNLYIRSVATGGYAFVVSLPQHVGDSPLLDATPDLSHLVFQSDGPPLTPDAAVDARNVYEWTDGRLRLVNRMPDGSVDPDGVSENLTLSQGLALMQDPHIVSADGARILFEAADSSGESKGLYMRKNGAETVAVSASQRPGDPAGARPASLGGAGADGNLVYFLSAENLTSASDTRLGFSLYRYDATSGSLTDLTVATDPADATDGANVLRVLNVTDDGASVYFVATGNLAAGGVSGRTNIYMWHDGSIEHVATLDAAAASEFRGPDYWSMSPSGRYLAFATYSNGANLTGQDTSGPACPGGHPACREVFVYDAQADRLACASCPRNGQAPRGGARMGSANNDGRFQYSRRFVLDNGRAFFDSPDPLTADDTNGRVDVYEWRAGVQRLISAGNADTDAWFSDASATGDSVFFATSQALVGQDDDSIADLYVARTGGGLAGQAGPKVAPPCSGDACQGALDTAPAAPVAATVTFTESAGGPPASRPGAAKITVSKPRAISGTSAGLKIKVSQKGRLTVAGSGLSSAKRTVRKAGTYTIKVALTARARRTLRAKRTVRTTARVSFTTSSGAKSTVTVALTFKSPTTRKGR
jgi:hypothetical protein